MKLKAVSIVALLAFMLSAIIGTQPVSATLYISSDYTFTSNIYEPIVVTADDITIDGNGYTLQKPGPIGGDGIYLDGRSNVTIKNLTVKGWFYGIYLVNSGINTISGNTVTDNRHGIWVAGNDNTISNNTVTDGTDLLFSNGITLQGSGNSILGNTIINWGLGIYLDNSDDNTLSVNTLSDNRGGIHLESSCTSNMLSSNTVSDNWVGIWLKNYCEGNTLRYNTVSRNLIGIELIWSCHNLIYHNNIVDNSPAQAIDSNSAETDWHHPDLLEGNYWSNYPGVDDGSGTGKHDIANDGIGDTNIPWSYSAHTWMAPRDYYPLMAPWIPDPVEATHELSETIESWNLKQGTENSLMTKMDAMLSLLDDGNVNGAIHKLGDLIKQVENDKKKLTEAQRSELLQRAYTILYAII